MDDILLLSSLISIFVAVVAVRHAHHQKRNWVQRCHNVRLAFEAECDDPAAREAAFGVCLGIANGKPFDGKKLAERVELIRRLGGEA